MWGAHYENNFESSYDPVLVQSHLLGPHQWSPAVGGFVYHEYARTADRRSHERHSSQLLCCAEATSEHPESIDTVEQQTPMGIRFVGFIALFFGVNSIGDGFALIKNPREFLDFLKDFYTKQAPEIAQMPAFKSIGLADMRTAGVICLILGLCMAVNVVLNLRLLRWYLLLRKNDAS